MQNLTRYESRLTNIFTTVQVPGLTEKAEPVRSAESQKKLNSATEVLQKVILNLSYSILIVICLFRRSGSTMISFEL